MVCCGKFIDPHHVLAINLSTNCYVVFWLAFLVKRPLFETFIVQIGTFRASSCIAIFCIPTRIEHRTMLRFVLFLAAMNACKLRPAIRNRAYIERHKWQALAKSTNKNNGNWEWNNSHCYRKVDLLHSSSTINIRWIIVILSIEAIVVDKRIHSHTQTHSHIHSALTWIDCF